MSINETKFEIEILNRYNMEYCTLQLTMKDDTGKVIDVVDGPMRYVINRVLDSVSPNSKLGIRKVKK